MIAVLDLYSGSHWFSRDTEVKPSTSSNDQLNSESAMTAILPDAEISGDFTLLTIQLL